MTPEMLKQVKAVVHSEAEAIVNRSVRLHLVLKRIIDDLPQKRDWLDPDLEREARELIKMPITLDVPKDDHSHQQH